MATKSILKNIEISDPAEAEKLVKALEEAKKICDGAHFALKVERLARTMSIAISEKVRKVWRD